MEIEAWVGVTNAIYEMLEDGADPNGEDVRLAFRMRDAIGSALTPQQTTSGGRYYESEAQALPKRE